MCYIELPANIFAQFTPGERGMTDLKCPILHFKYLQQFQKFKSSCEQQANTAFFCNSGDRQATEGHMPSVLSCVVVQFLFHTHVSS